MAYSNERELDIEGEFNNYVTDSMRSLALSFIRNITLKSPKDTGRFASNWNFSVEQPNEKVTLSRSNLNNNILRQKKVIDSSRISTVSTLWISNNLPYGPRLNNGWSDQAPAFFVEQTARISGIDIPDGTL